MSETTLLTILMILLLFLIPLILSYWVFPEKKISKKKKSKPFKPRRKPLSFEEILYIFGSKSSSKEQLIDAIEQLVSNYGRIHPKLGELPHPDFKRYLLLIIELCNNSQADKDIIFMLDKRLRAKNPKYGLEIDEAINKGIAARGF